MNWKEQAYQLFIFPGGLFLWPVLPWLVMGIVGALFL